MKNIHIVFLVSVSLLQSSTEAGKGNNNCKQNDCEQQTSMCNKLPVPSGWSFHCIGILTGACPNLCTENAPSTSKKTTTVDYASTTFVQSTESRISSASPMCPCPCKNGFPTYNLSDPVSAALFEQKLTKIKKKLTVNKKNLTSFRNTKLSARDDRVSATVAGAVGLIVLVSVVSLIVVPDLVMFVRFLLGSSKEHNHGNGKKRDTGKKIKNA